MIRCPGTGVRIHPGPCTRSPLPPLGRRRSAAAARCGAGPGRGCGRVARPSPGHGRL